MRQNALRERVVVQIPVAFEGHRAVAYPEHVSGGKHKIHLAVVILIVLFLAAHSLWDATHGTDGGGDPKHATLRHANMSSLDSFERM